MACKCYCREYKSYWKYILLISEYGQCIVAVFIIMLFRVAFFFYVIIPSIKRTFAVEGTYHIRVHVEIAAIPVDMLSHTVFEMRERERGGR